MKILAQETISFQGSAFFDALCRNVEELRQTAADSQLSRYWESDSMKKLCQTIKDFTGGKNNPNGGLTIVGKNPTIYGEYMAGIFVPHLANGHIFQAAHGYHYAGTHFADLVQELFKKYPKGIAEGQVDIRKNHVSGFFSDITYHLFLGTVYIKKQTFTVEEVAAIILHEVGHAFTNCEYLSRTLLTNQVLATLAREVDKNPEKPFKVVLVESVNSNKLTADQARVVEKAKDMQECVVYAYLDSQRVCLKELGISLYETTSCEQLADQYANRCGAGRALATALAKMNEDLGKIGHGQAMSVIKDVCGLLLNTAYVTACFGVTIASAGVPVAVAATIGAVSALSFGYLTVRAQISMLEFAIYDDDKYRLERIKHDIVQRLKSQDVSAEVVKEITDSIEVIDKLIAKTQTQGSTSFRDWRLGHHVAMFFSNVYRKRYDSELIQKQLEQIASNPLFMQAAKLRTL